MPSQVRNGRRASSDPSLGSLISLHEIFHTGHWRHDRRDGGIHMKCIGDGISWAIYDFLLFSKSIKKLNKLFWDELYIFCMFDGILLSIVIGSMLSIGFAC